VLAHLLGTACLAAVAHTTSASAQTVPTCRLGAGILQIVGLTLTYTAGNGDANDVRVVKTGGTYTPGNTEGSPHSGEVPDLGRWRGRLQCRRNRVRVGSWTARTTS
jgi:hypothetical protein